MEETKPMEKKQECRRGIGRGSSSDAVYGLGIIGAAVYFIQHAATFWSGVLGILEALVWPALLVYKALEFFWK